MKLQDRPQMEMTFTGARVTMNLYKTDIEEIVNFFGKLKSEVEYDITAKERARRSLNANAYYWTLVQKIAEANGISNAEAHNHLLQDYGCDWIDDSGDRTYILMKDDDRYLRMDTTHYRPTDATEDRKGTTYRWMVLLLPSHLMSKQEMSRLIDGAVSEAKELGIETRTPEEIGKLIEKWG